MREASGTDRARDVFGIVVVDDSMERSFFFFCALEVGRSKIQCMGDQGQTANKSTTLWTSRSMQIIGATEQRKALLQ